ncbi:hypothetical protein GCM10011519_08260 [Marmoricola endophyticus]|uniref:DUF402 domain-containing protein n=1 Tax=Marmoricola endophyticus TaxID=2040280 RepID=A0A917F2P2_9ACTN|nr:DUF402 domain-containing protein [Marmoricola endophyticus]GGF37108.1 hypothetical protein GCM10011519_08260 [Marmoricola endophyticus]
MTPVRIECRKWPDSPHWEMDAHRLGMDEHGVWCGIRKGTVMTRPGAAITAVADHVTLAPYDDWWLATFYGADPVADAGRPFATYVDITTPSYWLTDTVLRAVDLDLDVIRGTTGRIWVDDEDEFAEHRRTLGYPIDVVEHARESCTSIEAAMRAGEPPFDSATAHGWLARFRRS